MKKPTPTAFLHTMHMELDQTNGVPTLTDVNPFGRQGRDYDPTYKVTTEPLFTAAELLAPYEHGGELHKAVFMALESYGGADTFRDGVLALVQQSRERGAALDASAKPVGVVIGFQLVNKVHRYPTVAWRAEDLPGGTELFTRPQQSAEVETLAELALARRYLEQALAALNPRAQLATNIRKLLDIEGRPKAAPKTGQLTEHGYIINTWETGVSAHDPVTGKTAEIDRRKYLSLSVATVAAIQNLKKMIDEV